LKRSNERALTDVMVSMVLMPSRTQNEGPERLDYAGQGRGGLQESYLIPGSQSYSSDVPVQRDVAFSDRREPVAERVRLKHTGARCSAI
jgi:hypothetical protein